MERESQRQDRKEARETKYGQAHMRVGEGVVNTCDMTDKSRI